MAKKCLSDNEIALASRLLSVPMALSVNEVADFLDCNPVTLTHHLRVRHGLYFADERRKQGEMLLKVLGNRDLMRAEMKQLGVSLAPNEKPKARTYINALAAKLTADIHAMLDSFGGSAEDTAQAKAKFIVCPVRLYNRLEQAKSRKVRGLR